MEFLIILLILILIFLIILYYFYRFVYKSNKKIQLNPYAFSNEEQYIPFHDKIKEYINYAISLPNEDIYITTKQDNIKLHSRLYLIDSTAPIHLMFHGYNGNEFRDFAPKIKFTISELKHNVLLVDQRSQGKSQGRCMTFGIKERKDVIEWITYINQRFDNPSLILEGVSMGAATVLMSSNLSLPLNVKGIIADCPYSTPKDILINTIKGLKLPIQPCLFFSRLAGIFYGGFDIYKESPLNSVKNSRVPILLIHGDDDRFVPYYMSEEIYKACNGKKYFLTIPQAGHVLSYYLNPSLYKEEVNKFINSIIKK